MGGLTEAIKKSLLRVKEKSILQLVNEAISLLKKIEDSRVVGSCDFYPFFFDKAIYADVIKWCSRHTGLLGVTEIFHACTV